MTRWPTEAEIAARDQAILERQQRYRVAADRMAERLARQAFVERVALIGSVARKLWRHVPSHHRRPSVAVAHHCKDVDLAIWVTRLDALDALRRDRTAVSQALPIDQGGIPVHEIEMFLFEPGTDRYLGRVCYFGRCRADQPDCVTPGCGAQRFLKQHEDFTFWPESLEPSRMTLLFDRSAGGIVGQASTLPSVIDDAPRLIDVTVTIPEHRRGELAELVLRWKQGD